mmetsp:Transcript_32663/g.102838  ORF Transcript_32663/g.102838 Transcript_32663/m.102838 type:complete len:239 (+) Transcript_32663:2-718(+)
MNGACSRPSSHCDARLVGGAPASRRSSPPPQLPTAHACARAGSVHPSANRASGADVLPANGGAARLHAASPATAAVGRGSGQLLLQRRKFAQRRVPPPPNGWRGLDLNRAARHLQPSPQPDDRCPPHRRGAAPLARAGGARRPRPPPLRLAALGASLPRCLSGLDHAPAGDAAAAAPRHAAPRRSRGGAADARDGWDSALARAHRRARLPRPQPQRRARRRRKVARRGGRAKARRSPS